MSAYRQGRDREWAVVADLKDNGYKVSRAASSKGDLADVQALKPGQVLFVNVKKVDMPGPAERLELLRMAWDLPGIGVPLVALKPPRQPLEYRRLTGSGPIDWQPWTPDEIGDAA